MARGGALADLRVLELVLAGGELGRGMATGVAAMFLADQGAEVVRVVAEPAGALDDGVEFGRVWHRGKRSVPVELDRVADVAAVRKLLEAADVALVGGAAEIVQRGPLAYGALSEVNQRLVYCSVAPDGSSGEGEDGQDYDLLVQARTGLMSLLQGKRPAPVVAALEFGSFGAALAATGGIFAALIRRRRTGRGQLVETSLEAGAAAELAMVLNRAERPSRAFGIALGLGTSVPTWLYQCADDRWLHLHPGAKGAYQRILELFGDEASQGSRWAEARSRDESLRQHERWQAAVRSKDRDTWLAAMRSVDIPVQPVLEPGMALFDDHVREVGLSLEQPDGDATILAVGSPVRVRGLEPPAPVPAAAVSHVADLLAVWSSARPAGDVTEGGGAPPGTEPPLEGVRVLDFGAFLAGPLGDALLGDLGAEVIKVEPLEGDPLRTQADHDLGPVFASAQRGKRSLSIDLKSPDAASVLTSLFEWADIVHHNFRPGAAERLGVDEATVREANPDVVYCHSPAFGSTGPDRGLPGFDQMFQAFCGLEAAAGGEGQPPMWYGPAPVDTGGGWLSAIAMLLGHLRHLDSGEGVYVESTQLGAALLATSGVFVRDSEVVAGPRLDAGQTGFGPGYRIYRCAAGEWLAVVIPDQAAWSRLRAVPGMPPDLPERFNPLRLQDEAGARSLEAGLEAVFAGRTVATWIEILRGTGVRVARVEQGPPERFLELFFDRPENLERGRVARFEQGHYGMLEQVAFAARLDGVVLQVRRPVPAIGEHSVEILAEIGVDPVRIEELMAAGVVRRTLPAAADVPQRPNPSS